MNAVLRSAGFGVLIMLAILVPVYKIYGMNFQFWLSLAACLGFTLWAYAAYRRLYSVVICPKCGMTTNILQTRKNSACPKCGRDLHGTADK
ncbi:MAG: hypothetical protein JXA46_06600 [Dehalococcoidales bacterium]|nr:hypothetical protein [Dehalococcoidales bacterium]